MKVFSRFSIFIFLINLLNVDANNITTKDNSTVSNTIEQQHQDYFAFVVAISGLNYRATPKGKLLGKFPLNTKVTVIKHTGIKDQITDEGMIVKGEWVGVQHKTETVYVFNAFLSSSPLSLSGNIYKLTPHYVDNDNETSTAFVNVSETYFENKRYDRLVSNDDRKKDTTTLSPKQRKVFLKTVHISEDDTIFIYELKADKVHSYKIKDLPVISCLNIYSDGLNPEEYEYEEYEYEYGFDLGKLKIDYDDNFVSIGKDNPFQTGHLEKMIWKEIDTKNFPKRFDVTIVDESIRSWFDGVVPEKSYVFSDKNYNFYLQNLQKNGVVIHRYLAVTNKNSNKVFYENVYMDDEGSYLTPIKIEDNEDPNDYYSQWTGKMFKDEPSVIFGFTSASFGCTSIGLVDKKASNIRVLCDNRH